MSHVADNTGELVDAEPVLIDASLFHNFVMMHQSDSDSLDLTNHSMQSCVEYILERGKAEIERQIRTAGKQRENKVYGDLARKYNLTFDQAKAVLEAAAVQAKQK